MEYADVRRNKRKAHCAGLGYIDTNPAQFTNKNPEASRERVLSLDELAQLWRALPEGDYGDILKLLALTGQRASEIADLGWDEVDPDFTVITLPARRRSASVPLTPGPFSARSANLDALPEPATPVNDRRRLTQHSLPSCLLGITWVGLSPTDRASFA